MPFFMMGLALIIGSVLVNIAMQFPWTAALIGGVFGPAISEGFTWIANSLEIIVPLGIFLMAWRLVGPLIAGAISIAVGLIMWLVLML